jgi:hypothetical protein
LRKVYIPLYSIAMRKPTAEEERERVSPQNLSKYLLYVLPPSHVKQELICILMTFQDFKLINCSHILKDESPVTVCELTYHEEEP